MIYRKALIFFYMLFSLIWASFFGLNFFHASRSSCEQTLSIGHNHHGILIQKSNIFCIEFLICSQSTCANFDSIFNFQFSSGCLKVIKSLQKLNIIYIDSHISEVLIMRSVMWAIKEIIDPFYLKKMKGILIFTMKTLIH